MCTRLEDHRKFPSLGGVAGPKGLTGWLVAFVHTLGGPPLIPLLRRGGRPEGADGVVGCVCGHAWRTTPALRATPPKEGNGNCRRFAPSFFVDPSGPPRRFAPPLLRRGITPDCVRMVDQRGFGAAVGLLLGNQRLTSVNSQFFTPRRGPSSS